MEELGHLVDGGLVDAAVPEQRWHQRRDVGDALGLDSGFAQDRLATLFAVEEDDGAVDNEAVLAEEGGRLENAGTTGDHVLRN